MSPYVFLSHSSKNESVTDVICKSLEASGIRCWLASRDVPPGANWGEAIIDGINDTQLMVVILTADSIASRHVEREIERADSLERAIISLRIEDVQLSKSLEYFLSNRNWLDAFTPPLQDHLDILAGRIKNLIGTQDEDHNPLPAVEGREPTPTSSLNRVGEPQAKAEDGNPIKKQEAEAADLFSQSKKHRAAYDYPAAIRAMEDIPEGMRNADMASYLAQLRSDHNESERLLALIKDRIGGGHFIGLIGEVQRAIALRGDREDLLKLEARLKEHEQKNREQSLEKNQQPDQTPRENVRQRSKAIQHITGFQSEVSEGKQKTAPDPLRSREAIETVAGGGFQTGPSVGTLGIGLEEEVFSALDILEAAAQQDPSKRWPISMAAMADIENPAWLQRHIIHLKAMDPAYVQEQFVVGGNHKSIDEWAQAVRDTGAKIKALFTARKWTALFILLLEDEFYLPFLSRDGDPEGVPEQSPLMQIFEVFVVDFARRQTVPEGQQEGSGSLFLSGLTDDITTRLIEKYPILAPSDDGAFTVGCLMSFLVPIIYGIWGFIFAAVAVVVSGIIGALASRDGNRGEGMGAALAMSAGLGTVLWWIWKLAVLGYTWVSGWFG